MGIVFRQSVKATLAVGGGAVLGALINFIGPQCLDKAQLGLSRNITNGAAVLQFFALLGVNNTLATFLPRYAPGDPRRKALLGYGLLLPVLAALVVAGIILLARMPILGLYQSQDRPLLSAFFPLLPAITALWCCLSLLEAVLIAEQKTALMLFNREVVLRLVNVVLLVGLWTSLLSFQNFIWGHLLLYVVPLAVALWMARRTGHFTPSLRVAPDPATRHEWIHFSWYHLLTAVALNLTGLIDPLLLPTLDPNGLASLGVYSIALYVASVLYIPYKAMIAAAFPVLNEAWTAGDRPKLIDLFARTGVNILIASVLLLVLLIIGLPVLQWLLPARYAGVSHLVLILLIGRFTDIASGMNSELLSISSRYKFAFRLSGGLLVVLVGLNVLLIPRFGATGAAWSATLALVLFNTAKMLYLARQFRVVPAWLPTAKVLLAGTVAAAALLLPGVGHPLADGVLRGAVAALLYGGALYKLRPSPDLQAYFASIRKNKRLF